MTTYSYRPYRPGDEVEINKLYEEITGRRRTKEAYFWQWLEAPGGKGEIWLIEADEADGSKKLIGHHGVMPIRFSRGQDDLLFGKTENTFVHPDYRTKILYPRFEARFRNEYEPRFHALFSTFGPREAIRQRKAQGYRFPAAWKSYTWHLRPQSILYFICKHTRIIPSSVANLVFLNRNKNKFFSETFRYSDVDIKCYGKEDAMKTDFFRTFWNSIKNEYGITPSRDYSDLKWRYWDNPYIAYHTLLIDSKTAGSGVAVVCMTMPNIIRIDDFITEQPRSRSFGFLLKAVLKWAKTQRTHAVQFTTTDDSIGWIGPDNFNPGPFSSIIHRILKTRRKSSVVEMPRKICNLGNDLRLSDQPWYITGSIFEGNL